MNYARFSFEMASHAARWKARVGAIKPPLTCQECRGSGGFVDVILDDGSGPFETCGWCEGEGLVDAHRRGMWLASRRSPRGEG